MKPLEGPLESRTAAGALRAVVAARPERLVAAIAVAAAVFFALTLRAGQSWGDDFAMYVLHARAIVEGLPYAETGYIPNPWGVPGPPTYPPIYPLMLAPVYALFGLDYEPMKLLTVLCYAAVVIVVDRLFARRLGVVERWAFAATLAFNPWIWEFKDEVYSDIPFLLLCYLALLIAEGSPGERRDNVVGRGVLLGVLAYLAYGTRSLGIVLLPCIACAELIASRRVSKQTMIAGALFASGVVAQNLWLHSDQGYQQSFTLDPAVLTYNAVMYARSFSFLWVDGANGVLRAAIFAIVTLLALIGYMQALRRRVGVLEIFPVLYLTPIVCYSVGTMIQHRYVMPVVPLYLYYALLGLRSLGTLLAPNVRRTALAGVAVLLLAQYTTYYVRADYGPKRDGVTSSAAAAVFDFLRTRSSPDDVIVMGKARACALYTGRRCASPFGYRTDAEIEAWLRTSGTRFVVLGAGPLASQMDYEHPDDWPRFAATHADALRAEFSAGDLTVYRVAANDARESR